MSRPIRTVALAFTAASVVVVAALAQTNGQPERFIANAINMNRGASGNVEIVVNRWSTDSQRDTLMSTLMSKGPDKLLDKLQDMPRMEIGRASCRARV